MTEEAKKGERIAKYLSRAGVCSRRDAERLILEGRVSLNGKILTSPAQNVVEGDKIYVDKIRVGAKEETRLWRYHKPRGLVTSHKDEKGRDTIFDHMPDDMPRVMSVGRLDLTTEGLILLTNNGELARHLELPATGWTRKYRVRAFGVITQGQLDKLADGIKVDGVFYNSIKAKLEKEQGDNVWIEMTLTEGKNREIRKVLEHLGLKVNRLIRVSYGPFILGKLEEGEAQEIGYKAMKEALGGQFLD
jgi:23S rRNA pseudouridine2605 synthase